MNRSAEGSLSSLPPLTKVNDAAYSSLYSTENLGIAIYFVKYSLVRCIAYSCRVPLVKSEFYDTRASPCCVVLSEGIVFHQASILPSSFAKLVLPKSVESSVPDPEV